MIEYWNIYLVDETITTTRSKYSWLDNCAFIGGNIDFIVILVSFFFSFYNYKIADIQDFKNLNMSIAAKDSKLVSKNIKILDEYSFTLILHLLLT